MKFLPKSKNNSRKSNGFTLIETMIVVAIMGIITVTAWPSYERYQTKSRRADGVSALLEARSKIEKCYLTVATSVSNSGYTHSSCSPTITSREGYYNITGTLGVDTYTLSATPTGVQSDPECNVLTITHLGVKGFTGTANITRCWSQ